MSYFQQTKLTDQNDNVIERVDLVNVPEKDILLQILKELKILNMQMAILTDNEISKDELD